MADKSSLPFSHCKFDYVLKLYLSGGTCGVFLFVMIKYIKNPIENQFEWEKIILYVALVNGIDLLSACIMRTVVVGMT